MGRRAQRAHFWWTEAHLRGPISPNSTVGDGRGRTTTAYAAAGWFCGERSGAPRNGYFPPSHGSSNPGHSLPLPLPSPIEWINELPSYLFLTRALVLIFLCYTILLWCGHVRLCKIFSRKLYNFLPFFLPLFFIASYQEQPRHGDSHKWNWNGVRIIFLIIKWNLL